jgi:derlin-1
MSSNEFRDWYQSIPKITRGWFTASIALPLIGRLGLLNPYTLILLFEPFVKNFHVNYYF